MAVAPAHTDLPAGDAALLGSQLVAAGATRPARILTATAAAVLAEELAALKLDNAPERVGKVRQVAATGVVDLDDERRWPHTAKLAGALGALLSRWLTGHLAGDWRPNEAAVMRYPRTGGGMSAHLDRRRYRDLIAIVTVEGAGELAVVRDRAGRHVIMRHICRSGDLVVLRAPGFAGKEDCRPLHQVGPPLGSRNRVSLTFRFDSEAVA